MKKTFTTILVTLFVCALMLTGCGGSGGGTQSQGPGLAGDWFAGAYQMHDDGSVTEISIDTLTIGKDGAVSGIYTVTYYPATTPGGLGGGGGTIQPLETGNLMSGDVSHMADGIHVHIQFPGENRGGGPGPRSLETIAQMESDNNYALGFAGVSDIGPPEFRENRQDYYYGMYRYQGVHPLGKPAHTREAALERLHELQAHTVPN